MNHEKKNHYIVLKHESQKKKSLHNLELRKKNHCIFLKVNREKKNYSFFLKREKKSLHFVFF
jgi:ribosomal protein L30/L7E